MLHDHLPGRITVKKLLLMTLGFAICGLIVNQIETNAAPRPNDRAALVARGQYLVENVAMCVQCHTPRNQAGELDRTQLFRGAPIPIQGPPFLDMNWAVKAPNIVGLLGYTEEDAIRLLTEGLNRTGAHPKPPMPPFRMNQEDAAAVVAYLKSLAQ
jgi:mono/diheme cytochrome c family protein